MRLQSLEHLILEKLFLSGLTRTGNGTVNGKLIVHDEYLIGTAYLQYGVLIALVNGNDIIKEEGAIGLGGARVYKEDIKIAKYSFKDVAMAITILESNGDIKSSINEDRLIALTESGLLAYASRKYLEPVERKQFERQLRATTIRTSWILVIFAAISLIVACLQYTKPDKIEVPQLDTLNKNVQFIIDRNNHEKLETVLPLKADAKKK